MTTSKNNIQMSSCEFFIFVHAVIFFHFWRHCASRRPHRGASPGLEWGRGRGREVGRGALLRAPRRGPGPGSGELVTYIPSRYALATPRAVITLLQMFLFPFLSHRSFPLSTWPLTYVAVLRYLRTGDGGSGSGDWFCVLDVGFIRRGKVKFSITEMLGLVGGVPLRVYADQKLAKKKKKGPPFFWQLMNCRLTTCIIFQKCSDR